MKRSNSNLWTLCGAAIALGGVLLSGAVQAQSVTGNWTFNDTYNAEGSLGNPLDMVNGTWNFQDALIGATTARVARFARMTAVDQLRVRHNLPPNGGGSYVNQYTVIMDVLFPAGGNPNNSWIALLSTNYDTYNDADWYINDPDLGMGIGGDYTDPLNPLRFTRDTWHRIVLVIDLAASYSYRSYIDGVLQNEVQDYANDLDGGMSLYSTNDTTPWFLLFTEGYEPDGLYASEGLINNLQVRNYAMSDIEVLALGGPTASPIPVPGAILSGTLNLEDVDENAPRQQITFTFRPTDMSGDFDLVAEVGPDGAFTLNAPNKNYQLHIKGKRYLARNVNVNATLGNVSGIETTLTAGDATGDNSVDVLDLDQLIQGFDSGPSDLNWKPEADFNVDGSIDVLDLDILIRNFDKQGDE
jgi:hypothetical protein